ARTRQTSFMKTLPVRSCTAARLLLLAMTMTGACGTAASHATDGGQPPQSCGTGIDSPPDEGRVHVPEGTTVSYRANPPASGPHYPTPAPWGVAATELPRERWVHNLEHGGLVLLYHCPTGCPDVVAGWTSLMASRPPDQFNEVRLLLTADSVMPHRLAA